MKNSIISISKLAKMINVHKLTLRSWLCHYTLGKYVEEMWNERGQQKELAFKFNEASVKAFRKYLNSKKRKYLVYFDARFPDFEKKFAETSSKNI